MPSIMRRTYVMGLVIAAAVIVAFMLSYCSKAHAAEPGFADPAIGDCYSYNYVADTLKRLYGEVGSGPVLVPSTKTAGELFIGPAGSLTVVEIFPNNTACYRAFNSTGMQRGEGWNSPVRLVGSPL